MMDSLIGECVAVVNPKTHGKKVITIKSIKELDGQCVFLGDDMNMYTENELDLPIGGLTIGGAMLAWFLDNKKDILDVCQGNHNPSKCEELFRKLMGIMENQNFVKYHEEE